MIAKIHSYTWSTISGNTQLKMFLFSGCAGYLCARGAIRAPRCTRGRRGRMPLIGLTPVRGGELPGRLGDGRNGWAVGWRGAGTVPAQVAGEHACHYAGAQ